VTSDPIPAVKAHAAYALHINSLLNGRPQTAENEGAEKHDMEVVSRIYRGFVVWMSHDEEAGHWRYNLARLPLDGSGIQGPDETETVGPFGSEQAAYEDAVGQIDCREVPPTAGRDRDRRPSGGSLCVETC
jgi:hypothetical protein